MVTRDDETPPTDASLARVFLAAMFKRVRSAHKPLAIRQFVTQTRLHGEGVTGNCMAAVMASLFGGKCDDYNHVYDKVGVDVSHYHDTLDAICNVNGFRRFVVSADDGCPRGLHLASGLSPRGIRHVVIRMYDTVVWDPHPSRAGLDTVTDLTILVPWIT